MIPTSDFPRLPSARTLRNAVTARTVPALLAAAALTLSPASMVRAQTPGMPDPEFNPATVAATVYALLFVTDENQNNTIYVEGDNAYSENLQPNGVVKGNFVSPIFGTTGRIIFTAVPERNINPGQTGPKILIGGLFGVSAYQNFYRLGAQNILRLLPDGAEDTSFNVSVGANNFVTSILPLQNGNIVVGGQFTSFRGETRLRIVRLNNDGTIDESFNASSAIDNDVLALAEGLDDKGNADGTTLVAGTFNHVGGLPVTKLARLDASGNLDQSFRPVIDTRVLAIAVQPTGKIIIGGEFTNVNGTPVSHIARLNRDGSLDTTFSASVTGEPTGESNPVAVYVLRQVQAFGVDAATGKPFVMPGLPGKIYVGGNFTQIDGATRRYLGLINPNGTVGAFDPGVAIYDKVQSIAVQPNNGRVLIGETLGPKIGKTYVRSYLRLFGATPFN